MLTAIGMPARHDAGRFRRIVPERFDASPGIGLAKLAGGVCRIGHLGGCNEPALVAAPSGIGMGLRAADVPHRPGGVMAAPAVLRDRAAIVERPKAAAAARGAELEDCVGVGPISIGGMPATGLHFP